ncbi:MAG TPA: hypothetical protein VGH29_12150 [Candidatus Binataceae bacterium]
MRLAVTVALANPSNLWRHGADGLALTVASAPIRSPTGWMLAKVLWVSLSPSRPVSIAWVRNCALLTFCEGPVSMNSTREAGGRRKSVTPISFPR